MTFYFSFRGACSKTGEQCVKSLYKGGERQENHTDEWMRHFMDTWNPDIKILLDDDNILGNGTHPDRYFFSFKKFIMIAV